MAGPARRKAPSFALPHARWKSKLLKADNAGLLMLELNASLEMLLLHHEGTEKRQRDQHWTSIELAGFPGCVHGCLLANCFSFSFQLILRSPNSSQHFDDPLKVSEEETFGDVTSTSLDLPQEFLTPHESHLH